MMMAQNGVKTWSANRICQDNAQKNVKPESQGENTQVPVGSQAVHSVPGGKSVEEKEKVLSIFWKKRLEVLKI